MDIGCKCDGFRPETGASADQRLLVFLPRPRYIGGRGIVFDRFLCMYLPFFVSLLARLRENGWTDLHEIFRECAE